MELFFDTETSGFPSSKLTYDDPKQAWTMQLAGILSDEKKIYAEFNFLIKAEGRECSPGAQKVHGISVGDCDNYGIGQHDLLSIFHSLVIDADILICHNFDFDNKLIRFMYEASNLNVDTYLDTPRYCTMKKTTNLVGAKKKNGQAKWPRLDELYAFLFDGVTFLDAHNALVDVKALRRCYYELKRLGLLEHG